MQPPKTFAWDATTKWDDMPKWLVKLIPPGADFDQLDETNQFDHVRFRIQHEIDIAEEEGLEEADITPAQLRNAIKFMIATGGRLGS